MKIAVLAVFLAVLVAVASAGRYVTNDYGGRHYKSNDYGKLRSNDYDRKWDSSKRWYGTGRNYGKSGY